MATAQVEEIGKILVEAGAFRQIRDVVSFSIFSNFQLLEQFSEPEKYQNNNF